MRRYKVGDKVQIKNLEFLMNNTCVGSNSIVNDMYKYAGKKARIEKLCNNDDDYLINIDGMAWVWTDGMFEEPRKRSYIEGFLYRSDGRFFWIKEDNGEWVRADWMVEAIPEKKKEYMEYLEL